MSQIDLRREANDDRRAAIAQATRALIVEKGFEGLRTRDVAARVGINIATLHYHVASKEALIELVAHSIKAQFNAQDQRRPRLHLSGLQRLRVEFEDFRETLVQEPDLAIVFSEMLDRARRGDTARDVMLPMHAHWNAQYEAVIVAGIADGTLRDTLDPKAGAMMICGALGDFWRRSPIDLDLFDRLTLELERSVTPLFSAKEVPCPSL